jgi:hypothetical protein
MVEGNSAVQGTPSIYYWLLLTNMVIMIMIWQGRGMGCPYGCGAGPQAQVRTHEEVPDH